MTTSKLNIKIADLFSGPSEVDDDFVAPNQALPNDFVDESQSDLQRNEQSKQELRDGWAERIDWDNAHGQQHGHEDFPPDATNPAYARAASKNPVIGTVLVQKGSVVRGRVAAQGIQGTVISEGTREFSVIWDDKVASTEEKANYRLINQR